MPPPNEGDSVVGVVLSTTIVVTCGNSSAFWLDEDDDDDALALSADDECGVLSDGELLEVAKFSSKLADLLATGEPLNKLIICTVDLLLLPVALVIEAVGLRVATCASKATGCLCSFKLVAVARRSPLASASLLPGALEYAFGSLNSLYWSG